MNINVKNALEFFKKQDYSAAITEFEEALKAIKDEPHILNNIGLCYAKLADDKAAEEYYMLALKQDKMMVQTYVNLADLLYKQRRIIEAINLLETAVTLMPDNIVLKHYLARIYIEDTRWDLAIHQLCEILDLSPANTDAFWDLGNIYFEMGDYDSAISNYEQILEKIDDNPIIFYQNALAYEANNNVDKAISNHLQAIALNPALHPSYKKLAVLFLSRGDTEDALEYFNDYLNFDLPEEEKQSIKDVIERITNKN